MRYTYDVLLNFQGELYDFFEWNEYDEILHIKKIPLFKVSGYDFNVFKNCCVCFDKNFMDVINRKCERFQKSGVCHINYAFLVSDGRETIGIKLNKKGVNYLKSSLLWDEGSEIADMALDLKDYNFNYEIISTSNHKFQTRFEFENYKKLNVFLNSLFKCGDYDKIRYLYLECFNNYCDNADLAYKLLRKEIDKCGNNYMKIFNFFKIIGQK